MKKLSLWSISIIALCSVSSCSPENDASTLQYPNLNVDAQNSSKGNNTLPENTANVYDSAGALYSEISQAFLELDSTPGSISSTITTVEALAANYPQFMTLKPLNYVSPVASQIENIVNDQQASVVSIISSSPLTAKAKIRLKEFIDTVMIYRHNNTAYSDVYEYIVDFETAISLDPSYTATDRKILLTTTSITRHGFHFKRKRKRPRDRDWDISWGSIIAGSEGSIDNTAKAVVMSVTTGIVLNN